MPFCPVCKYEYVEGVAKCNDCGENLVDKLPEDLNKNAKQRKWVKLRAIPGKVFADMAMEIFEREGIPYLNRSGELSSALGFSGVISSTNVYLHVPEDNVKECEKILDTIIGEGWSPEFLISIEPFYRVWFFNEEKIYLIQF